MAECVDVICIGGGAVGLSAAFELAKRSIRAVVVDRGPLGKESSWAGAGILSPPPASPLSDDDRLRHFSYHAFPGLAQQLAEYSGIDVGLRDTGGLELAFEPDEADQLLELQSAWTSEGVDNQLLAGETLKRREPRLQREPRAAVYLPGVRQVRNPRYVRALETACANLGVDLKPHRPAKSILVDNNRAAGVLFADGEKLLAGDVVVTAGAWAAQILEPFDASIPIYPVRGQIAAYQTSGHVVHQIVEVGKRYLVPRDDGLVLVGSTEEEVGFDHSTTDEGLAELHRFAVDLFPELDACPLAASWAGLRPACGLGFPWIGRVADVSNLWAAAGHFRQGIQLSPGTARLLADWLTGTESFADEHAFCPLHRQTPFQSLFHS
jgi:glycine oxidase